MAKLYFYYASMNAGKSTTLLQAAFNYRERGLHPMLWTATLDTRAGENTIASRIGLTSPAHGFTPQTDLYEAVINHGPPADCVLVDEAQFLTRQQVLQLARLCDSRDVPVVAYGLRTDFQGHPFEGSVALLSLADSLIELKGICHCGRKATMNLRVDAQGHAVTTGRTVEIGGNDRYVALCRRHWSASFSQPAP